MIKLENWEEVSRGFYRYVVAAKVCYEIHIIYWMKETDILTANAKLYIVGEWDTKNGIKFEREILLEGPVAACLEKAVEDEKGILVLPVDSNHKPMINKKSKHSK